MTNYDWDGLPPSQTPDAVPPKPFTAPPNFDDSLGGMASTRFNQLLLDDLLADSPVYLAHATGISLPYHYKDDNYWQANLDYLAKHHPEYLL